MDTAIIEQDRLAIGGNQPPTPAEELLATLEAETADIKKRIGDICVGLMKIPETIEDEDTAKKLTTFLGQAVDEVKALEEVRVQFKKPHDDLANLVQTHCKDIEGLISVDQAKIKRGAKPGLLEIARLRLGAYNERKRKVEEERQRKIRQAAELEAAKQRDEAARLQREAEEKARAAVTPEARDEAADTAARAHLATTAAVQAETRAAAPIVAKGIVRGAGVTSSARRTPIITIEDPELVPDAYWSVDPVKLRAAVDAGMDQIPGVKVEYQHSATIRT